MKRVLILFLVSITSLTFAQNSILFDASDQQYLTISNADDRFNATADFTYEIWVKFTSKGFNGQRLAPFFGGHESDYAALIDNKIGMRLNSNGVCSGDRTFGNTSTIDTDTWYHIAYVRSGSVVSLYLDGTLLGTTECSQEDGSVKGVWMINANTINIGAIFWNTSYLDGYIGGMRYVVGAALYSGDFTPQLGWEKTNETILLMNIKNEGAAFTDESDYSNTINVNGSSSAPTFVAGNGPTLPADILLSGDVSVENNSIKNVADPVYAQDAATKNYVDSNVNSFSVSYNDLTDIPVMYNQDEVDALIGALRSELGNQIDNDGDGFTEDGGDCNDNDATIVPNGDEINGDGVDNDCDGEIDELPDDSESSFSTADGKFIFGMGSNSYQLSGYYAFDPNTKTFSSAGLTPYQKNTYEGWTKPTVGSNGKVYEFTSETVIRNATDDVSLTLPNGYKAYTSYDYVNGFDSNVSSAIFLVRTDSMSEHGVHLAYVDDQDSIQILDPGFEFRGLTEMSLQYENGYFFIAKYGINNPKEYYIINFNEQNPQAVKINFPSADSNASPFSKTYAGDGKFYISYRKNNDDYNTKTIYLLDTTTDLVNNGLNVSEVFTTSSRADFLTYASNGKLYYNNEYGNNNDTNIYVYDPITGVESSIAAPSGASFPILLSSYGNTVELNGNLFIRYYFNSHTIDNVKNRLYELNISDNSLNEVNPNGILNNYQYWTTNGPYSNAYILNQPTNPMFVYNDKLYMIFRGSSDYDKHYIMIYDGNNVELIDPEQSGGLKSFVEQMFI